MAPPESGWNGAGTVQLQSEQVAGVDVRSAPTAGVTIRATVNGRLAGLGAPVYAPDTRVVVLGEVAWLPAPASAFLRNSPSAPSDPVAHASGDQATLSRFLAAGGTTRDVTGDGRLGAVWPGQPGCPAVRCNLPHAGHRSGRRKMVCKGDPCIYAADGDPMTWFTSPLVVPCSGIGATEGDRRPAPGLRHPGQLTDVHGREG